MAAVSRRAQEWNLSRWYTVWRDGQVAAGAFEPVSGRNLFPSFAFLGRFVLAACEIEAQIAAVIAEHGLPQKPPAEGGSMTWLLP
jgi:hypothetical protein